MSNRITEKFRELTRRGESALVCFVVAGYPDVKTSLKVIDALVKGGTDIIEIGIPFSDPIADGPTIQAASHMSLSKGITPDRALEFSKRIRKRHPTLPLLAMTYSNILIRAGLESFMSQAKSCGIDGFILPDMPLEESEAYSTAASKLALSTVFLASPNTPETRLKRLIESTSGFLYLVSVFGITGARKSFEDYTLNAIDNAKRIARGKVPVAVGFGISTSAHARIMIGAGADAIIVGSAIIDIINGSSGNGMLFRLQQFAKSIKSSCKK